LLVIITITVFKRYHNTANIRNVCFCKEKNGIYVTDQLLTIGYNSCVFSNYFENITCNFLSHTKFVSSIKTCCRIFLWP